MKKFKDNKGYFKIKVDLFNYIPVIAIILLIVFITICFSYMCVYSPTANYILTRNVYIKVPICIVFYISTIMIFVSYYQAIMINNSIKNISNKSTIISKENVNESESSYCKKCSCYRPYRAHHCSTCNVCIRQMDHHCPWIANCVGESNHKAFILLLGYSALSSFIASVCIFNELSYCIQHNELLPDFEDIESVLEIIQSIVSYMFPIFVFLCSIGSFIITVVLIINQMNFLTFGMTHIEWLQYRSKKYECPYFENNILKHFYTLFGRKWYQWFIPNKIQDNSIYDNKIKEYINNKER